MKLLVAKRDLQEALDAAVMTLAGSGTDITTHFLFRLVESEGQAPRVEILSHSGRTYSSFPLICTVSDTDKGKSFSVEGKRFKDGLDLLDDVAVTLDSADRLVTLTVPGLSKPFRFLSLDPASFPYWDDTVAAAPVTATILATRLKDVLSYAREFVSTEESEYPGLCVTEFRDGTLWAADKVGATLVTAVGLENVTARIHARDMPSVLRFLDSAEGEEIEVLESATKAVFLRRKNGALFGASKPSAPFPTMPGVDRSAADHHWWLLPKDGLIKAIRLAAWTAEKGDTKIRIARPDKERKVVTISMEDATKHRSEIEVELLDEGVRLDKDGNPDTVPEIPLAGFLLSYTPLLKILNNLPGDRFTLGISRRRTTGFIRYHEVRDEDDYMTVISWLDK